MNLPRFSTFLYLFILLSYFITGFITYFLGLKAVGESVRLPLLYYHVRTYIYLNICICSYSFLSWKYFLCSTNYSKFHLSKSVIFNVKFRIYLFLSFFVSFYLSFSFSFSFSLFLFSEQYWLNSKSVEHDGQVRLQIDRIFLLCHCKYFT